MTSALLFCTGAKELYIRNHGVTTVVRKVVKYSDRVSLAGRAEAITDEHQHPRANA